MNQRQLRVTIIGLHYSPEPSGNAPYTTGLAEGLIRQGHSVTVITGYPHYPAWRRHDDYRGWASKETINGVSVTRLRHHIPTKPTGLARLHMEISFGFRLLFTTWNRPDVVIFVSPALFSTAFGVLRAKIGYRRPSVGIWVQDLYSRGIVETSAPGGLTAKLLTYFESAVLRSANGVVAIHDRFRQYLVDVLNLETSSVVVIRNWTHLPAAPSEGQKSFRRRMGWGPDDFVVLHAGNMGMKQGLENVVNAALVAEQKGSNVRFVLMGDGHQRSTLEAAAEGLIKLSFVDSLPDEEFQLALTAADALLVNELPGVRDMSVPSKLTSYFNAGVPVIAATDEGSVTSVEVEASGGGIRVPAGDPYALVDSAEALADDHAHARNLGLQGLRFRLDTLAEATSINQYDDFVANLASSRSW